MKRTMGRRLSILIAGVALTVAALGAAAGAQITAGEDADQPITGDALARASEVSLIHLGEGKVTETEVGDEESYYEVEVTLDDGTEVDVQLDEEFNVVGQEAETGSDSD